MWSKNKFEKRFLRFITGAALLLLFFLLRKGPLKDWLLSYLFNAYTNGILDQYLASNHYIRYPVRYFKKEFKSNILFDYLLYPTMSLFINKITYGNRPFVIVIKVCLVTTSMLLVELWAEKNTNLIRWGRGWDWKHTLFGLTAKSLLNRSIIAAIRAASSKPASLTKR
ncbi:hypothetical protein GJU40_19635 [Bacillus lacus]|uniref:Uncharacterized protein n=1 Tax=Metabacillus lacus TaxID=1983721 RepID=A0A7X2J2S1_9BACI|nr:CBO0543 family protein [Metabacillus lacus]MRX74335.1 hypothetical protein [Metabacillus lacus]